MGQNPRNLPQRLSWREVQQYLITIHFLFLLLTVTVTVTVTIMSMTIIGITLKHYNTRYAASISVFMIITISSPQATGTIVVLALRMAFTVRCGLIHNHLTYRRRYYSHYSYRHYMHAQRRSSLGNTVHVLSNSPSPWPPPQVRCYCYYSYYYSYSNYYCCCCCWPL